MGKRLILVAHSYQLNVLAFAGEDGPVYRTRNLEMSVDSKAVRAKAPTTHQSIKSAWLTRYHQEYESLPRITTLPECERDLEFERREAIRHELLALPDAPKTIALSPVERIKKQFRTLYGVRCLTKKRFPDRDRLWAWIQADFDLKEIPTFAAKHLNRLANDLRIALLSAEQPIAPGQLPADPQKEIRAEALAAILAGGLAGMTQAAVSLPAGDRAAEVMRSMCASDETYYLWSADSWVDHLKVAKKTVTGCVAWKEIMQWRETQKRIAMPVKTAMQKAESSRRKQHKKLAE